MYVLGNGTAVWNRQISSMHDLTVTAAQQSGAEAFAMAGLAPKDIDVVQLYDAFTINTILFLEDLGFLRQRRGWGLCGRWCHRAGRSPASEIPTVAGCLACTPACTASLP